MFPTPMVSIALFPVSFRLIDFPSTGGMQHRLQSPLLFVVEWRTCLLAVQDSGGWSLVVTDAPVADYRRPAYETRPFETGGGGER